MSESEVTRAIEMAKGLRSLADMIEAADGDLSVTWQEAHERLGGNALSP